jgi:hypothetical protein
LVVTAFSGLVPFLAGVAWFTIFGHGAYVFLVRLGYRMDLHARALHWRSPLRSGRIPLDRLREIGPSLPGRRDVAFKVADGPSVRLMVVYVYRHDFVRFAEWVRAAAPHVDVRPDWYTRPPGRFFR